MRRFKDFTSSTLIVLAAGSVAHCGSASAVHDHDVMTGPGAATDAGLRPIDAGVSHADASGGSGGENTPAATSDASTQGGDANGSSVQQTPPPHVVGACDALPASGTWEDITPPSVQKQLPGPGSCTFGTGAMVMDPSNDATVYLGTCNMGIWKTSDCGSTWTHINTGKNGSILDTGRQWTFAIDPNNPQIVYTNSGYGATANGAYKSVNGGVDWQPIWPPADGTLSNVVAYNFVQLIAMDPMNSRHLLLSFHAKCQSPYNQACLAESMDAGSTWKVINGDPSWTVAEASYIYFLDGGGTWLWAPGSDQLFRTTDSGGHWTLADPSAGGHNFSPIYHGSDGSFYLALNTGLLRSASTTDGASWQVVINKPMIGITGNGTKLFGSNGFPWNPGQGPAAYEPFWTSPESDGTTWTQLTSPNMTNGGELAYDSDHHVLYSSNLDAGFWRVVTQ